MKESYYKAYSGAEQKTCSHRHATPSEAKNCEEIDADWVCEYTADSRLLHMEQIKKY